MAQPHQPAAPNSTAARIAAMLDTTEAPSNCRAGNPLSHLRSDLTAALVKRGLRRDDRAVAEALAAAGPLSFDADVAALADSVITARPDLFAPAPERSRTTLARMFNAGATPVTPGS